MSALPSRTNATSSTPDGAARVLPVALITGASAGIGLAAALRLAGAGYRLALLARNESRLAAAADQVAGEHPGATPALTIPTDVGDFDAAAQAVAETITRFGRLDLIVNNAGLAPLRPIADTTKDDYLRCFAVNTLGPAAIIAAAWPAFRRNHDNNEPGGRIINITTLATHDPFPGFAAYAAAKSAAASLVRSAKNEGADIGVRAFNIAPGAVETDMLRGLFDPSMLPKEACLAPDDVAKLILACGTGQRDEDNGKTIYISQANTAPALRVADA